MIYSGGKQNILFFDLCYDFLNIDLNDYSLGHIHYYVFLGTCKNDI